MNKSKLLKELRKMIEGCYEEKTGEMSARQEQATYQDGLLDAYTLIENL